MKKVSRREAMANLAAGGAGLALMNLTGAANADAIQESGLRGQTPNVDQAARALRGQHQPRPLTFDPAKLKGLSEKLIRSHWENNYGGAVKALNAVEQRLAAMLREPDAPAYLYGDLKREELVRTGSVVLHENYFANLGGDGKAAGRALDLIKQWFGSYEQWEAEFKRTANALAGGSGWAILACPRCDQRYVSIFTELIDWEDGNDPQYWTLLPITEAEAEGLVQQEASLGETSLNALGRGRRALRRDHPKAGPPRVFWGSGVLVGPHD